MIQLKTIIILDTNIFSAGRKTPPKLKTLKDTVHNYKELGEVYVPQTALDEATVHYYTFLTETIISRLENYTFLYDSIDLKYNLSEINYTQSYESIYQTISQVFENKIIPLESINYHDVYMRALRSEPPFVSGETNGDSGFKDTLIWLSILNYDYEKYDKVIFVTSDPDFQKKKNQDLLQKKFFQEHKIELKIREKLWQENKETTNKQEKTSTEKIEVENEDSSMEKLLEDYDKITIFRERLEQILSDIILKFINPFHTEPHTEMENPFRNNYYSNQEEYRFRIFRKINIDNFSMLKKHLYKIISESGLSSEISVEKFLTPYLPDPKINLEEYHKIDTDTLKKLLETMHEFEKSLPNYTNAFLALVNEKLNTISYEDITVQDDDLPF